MPINRPAHNSGLAKAAIKFRAKIKHTLGSLRQAALPSPLKYSKYYHISQNYFYTYL